jgi:ATP-dependent helicase/nuclease subunit B
MNSRFREYLDRGCTLVTAGNRLARRLHHQYAKERAESGLGAWETPDILPYSAWLQRCRDAIEEERPSGTVLLNAAQTGMVWRHIIEQSPLHGQLLYPAAVAREASHAWDLARQWRIEGLHAGREAGEDVRAFAAWAEQFRRRCAESGWLDPASLAAAVADTVRRHPACAGVQSIALAGFDELTPLQQELFTALRGSGWTIEPAGSGARNRAIAVGGFKSRDEEMAAAAAWAAELLGRDDGSAIGIIVPDIAARRQSAEYHLTDALMPQTLLAPAGSARMPFSIAPGRPLAEYPVIAAALDVLAFTDAEILLTTAGRVLRSPYVVGAQEAAVLAALDERLRRVREMLVAPAEILRAATAKRGSEIRAPFLGRLDALLQQCRTLPRRQSPRLWAATFSRLVTVLGWPGERAVNSVEFQCIAAWRDALGALASLHLTAATMTRQEALHALTDILAGTAFQPRSGETPIEVLGPSGAADMQFDHLWVMGLDEETWPPRPDPTPFLPLEVQRERGMPRASAAIELQRSRLLGRRLTDSAPQVVLSHPLNDGDRPLRPSPLLRELAHGAETLRPPVLHAAPAVRIFAARAAESFTDPRAPGIPEGWRSRGGAALFRDQAACPFRAFARHRLGAGAPEEPDVGLDAMTRGTVVHQVMEILWERLGDRGALERGDGALDAVVEAAVDAVLEPLRRKRRRTMGARFAALERARLVALAREWLQVELERGGFTVEKREEPAAVRFGGLEFTLRTDRVDRLPDGRRVILDYKTGDPKLKQWLGTRPEEPQLPLYAVTGGDDIAAIAFARLRRGNCGFVGLSEDAGLLPGVPAAADARLDGQPAEWPRLIESWRESLLTLAAEFQQGDARVAPRGPEDCRLCDLHPLCRIHEAGAGPQNDDNEH